MKFFCLCFTCCWAQSSSLRPNTKQNRGKRHSHENVVCYRKDNPAGTQFLPSPCGIGFRISYSIYLVKVHHIPYSSLICHHKLKHCFIWFHILYFPRASTVSVASAVPCDLFRLLRPLRPKKFPGWNFRKGHKCFWHNNGAGNNCLTIDTPGSYFQNSYSM